MFLRTGLDEREGEGVLKRESLFSVMVHCDDRLKHDRLLTLIRLFQYRNTGTRVMLVLDNNIVLHKGSSNSCTQLFARFSHNTIQTCLFYTEIVHDKNILP